MCSLCGWQMGKLVAFMSTVVLTELVGVPLVSLPVYHTQNKGDPGLEESVGAANLSASAIHKDCCPLSCVLSGSR